MSAALTIALSLPAATAVAATATAAPSSKPGAAVTSAATTASRTTVALDTKLADVIARGLTDAGTVSTVDGLITSRANAHADLVRAVRAEAGNAGSVKALADAQTNDYKLLTRGAPMRKVWGQRPMWKELIESIATQLPSDMGVFAPSSPYASTTETREAGAARLQAAASVYRQPGYDGPDATAAVPGVPTTLRTCTPLSATPLSFAPPALDHPIRVPITTSGSRVILDDDTDYILDLGSTPVKAPVKVNGGRNIVVVGGAISVPSGYDAGLQFMDQPSGATVHVEGVDIGGAGVGDGIYLRQPNDVTVQVENVRVDDVHGQDEVTFNKNHPDVLQSSSGPDKLLIDGLTGFTPYQGIFLRPDDPTSKVAPNIPTAVDLRRVDLSVRPGLAGVKSMLLWQSTPFPVRLSDVWLDGGTRSADQLAFPSLAAWPGATVGDRPTGSAVPVGVAGTSYCSPGYEAASVRAFKRRARIG